MVAFVYVREGGGKGGLEMVVEEYKNTQTQAKVKGEVRIERFEESERGFVERKHCHSKHNNDERENVSKL